MIHRLVNLPKGNSFFLFGARGTGKSYLLRNLYQNVEHLYVDLLRPDVLERYTLNPELLSQQVHGLSGKQAWVIIDEVQKAPKLLDLVHHLIETTDLKFALSGSSARKLKRGGANLLAGRAFVRYLFPLTWSELGGTFDLNGTLEWGSLPKLTTYDSSQDKADYLRAYCHTYMKEEISEEQIVRKLDPFRRFLQVAAQHDGAIINYSKIANDVGASVKTVQSYFQILEDTLLGFLLPPFHESIRKRQKSNPKFYFFDCGVRRALEKTISIPLQSGTYEFGRAFESFVMNEIYRLQSYAHKDFELSYLRTRDDAEIDLIVERPGSPRALVEIKSSFLVRERDVRHLINLSKDVKNSVSYCFSQEPGRKQIAHVECLHWQEGLRVLGLSCSG